MSKIRDRDGDFTSLDAEETRGIGHFQVSVEVDGERPMLAIRYINQFSRARETRVEFVDLVDLVSSVMDQGETPEEEVPPARHLSLVSSSRDGA